MPLFVQNIGVIKFKVHGPISIPYKENEKRSKHISVADAKEFWLEIDKSLAKERGCYVFCLKYRGKVIPYYIGKACKSFSQEVFTSHKLTKFNEALHASPSSKPVIYFVVHPKQKGKTNESAIDELETYLIQSAIMINPEIKNIHKTVGRKWTISNVIDQVPGRTREDEKSFSKSMGLSGPRALKPS